MCTRRSPPPCAVALDLALATASRHVIISSDVCGCCLSQPRRFRIRWMDSPICGQESPSSVESGMIPCANSHSTTPGVRCHVRLSITKSRRRRGSALGSVIRVVSPSCPASTAAGSPRKTAALLALGAQQEWAPILRVSRGAVPCWCRCACPSPGLLQFPGNRMSSMWRSRCGYIRAPAGALSSRSANCPQQRALSETARSRPRTTWLIPGALRRCTHAQSAFFRLVIRLRHPDHPGFPHLSRAARPVLRVSSIALLSCVPPPLPISLDNMWLGCVRCPPSIPTQHNPGLQRPARFYGRST